MNEKQRKILLTKIIPKFIIITVVLLAIVAFFTFKILGTKAEKDANKFWNNPKNKEKIENAIKKKKISNYVQPKTEQNKFISNSATQQYKIINKLKFPIPEGWRVKTDINEPSIDLFNVIIENKSIDGIISIMSRNRPEYINELLTYSDYQNEKLVRNMKHKDLTLNSYGIIREKYIGIDAIYETFFGSNKSTGENITVVSINMYYKDFAYTLFYTVSDEIADAVTETELL